LYFLWLVVDLLIDLRKRIIAKTRYSIKPRPDKVVAQLAYLTSEGLVAV